MELKNYQRAALDDLERFLQLCEKKPAAAAFAEFSKASYKKPLGEIPQICLKVPTGGGKTFMAAASLRTIFSHLPSDKTKMVVWLVPSETILTQTYKNLSDPSHPYRQHLNEKFSNVAVYTKEQLLQGEDFSPATVANRLSILVLGIDSFRRKEKGKVRAYQENGNLIQFANVLTPTDYLKNDDVAEISLMNVIRHYKPVVIIDESHHTKTDLSLATLADFNPSFVLELTATPRSDSNILMQVPSRDLKAENMVKIPVVVWNHKNTHDVIFHAIDLREMLEQKATAEGVRPIVLFQAESQSRGNEDRATFDKIKEELVNEFFIPAEQIAIKTATINELPPTLSDLDCPIRYIITINALKEGWDCPFAYILASLANRSSEIDVEQILGRILRRPFIKNFSDDMLNISYALTSSDRFNQTLQKVTKGLNAAGFSERDVKVVESVSSETGKIKLTGIENNGDDNGGDNAVEFSIKKDFADAKNLELPKFFRADTTGLFNDVNEVPVDRNFLCRDLDLELKDANVNFSLLGYEAVEYDIDGENNALSYSQLSDEKISALMNVVQTLSPEGRKRQAVDAITNILDRHYNEFSRADIQNYVQRVTKNFDDEEFRRAIIHQAAYAQKIIDKIENFRTVAAQENFFNLIDNGTIFVKPKYKLPETVTLLKSTNSPAKTLYTAEFADLNEFESTVIREIASWENVRWWHRNRERKDFCLNGFINHYPDFLVMLTDGTLMLVEVKGAHLDNDDSRRKAELGKCWAEMSGKKFCYYMVFDSDAPSYGYSFENFVTRMKNSNKK